MPKAAPNKWDDIVPNLPKLPPEDPKRQVKVDSIKAEITNREATELAVDYIALREHKKALEKELYDLNVHITAYEQLLTDSKEARAHGWGNFGVKDNALRLENGDTIRIQSEPYGKVIDKEAFRLWCIANGYEKKLQLWPSTMNSLVKERLEAGEEEPEGTEAYSYVKVIYVPAKEEK